MVEMVKAIRHLARIEETDEEAGFHAFENPEYVIPGLGKSKLTLHYYINGGNTPVRAQLLVTQGESAVGENTLTFTFDGHNRVIVSPDIAVEDLYQSCGIGRQLLIATEPIALHALANIPVLHGREVFIKITDEAGTRTQERKIRRENKNIKREGWTSHIIRTHLRGYQEVTQAGQPPTFTKKLR